MKVAQVYPRPVETDPPEKSSKPHKYFCVPPLKDLIAHTLISLIYEENVALPLSSLNSDILEFLASKMPFAVMHRVYEMKLCESFFNVDYLQRYASTTQFVDESRSMINKQLHIDHATKVGIWTEFRRECLRNISNITSFWQDYCDKEDEMAQRDRDFNSLHNINANSNSKNVPGKHAIEQFKKFDKDHFQNRRWGYREHYNLIVRLGAKYNLVNVPLYLIQQVSDMSSLHDSRRLRDLDTELKSFILKMKLLTNEFVPLKKQCTTYAPLPIWIKPSPANKQHKYVRSRTKIILQNDRLARRNERKEEKRRIREENNKKGKFPQHADRHSFKRGSWDESSSSDSSESSGEGVQNK